jgi:CBS domain containing-hemolysin-like protein
LTLSTQAEAPAADVDTGGSVSILGILPILAVLFANGFFVAAEYAVVRARKTRLEAMTHGRPGSARHALRILEQLDRYIATTQLAITMAGIGLGWVGEPILTALLERVVGLPLGFLDPGLRRSISALVSFVFVTFLTVVLSELVPKAVTIQYPERIALAVSRPVILTEIVFRPFIWALDTAADLVLRAFGLPPSPGSGGEYTVQELKLLMAQSEEEGVIVDTQRDMLHAVFDFGGTLVRQVMVPRTEVVAVEAVATVDELVRLAARHPFTKFPVYEGNLDHILGVVHIRDVLPALEGRVVVTKRARDLMREALFVPETTHVNDLLKRFRMRRQRMAIVLDEYGGTAGLVTLQDLLEEIVGQIREPFDAAPDIQPQADGTSLVDGLTPIEDVNEHFRVRLRDPHYDTIAGFILGRLGRLAQVGDSITVDGVSLRVESLDGRRIARVAISPAPPRRTQPAAE